ncbi:hypothetical protein KY290_005326 [Solanum tuberosum]|uniref:Uncharacterized protein n=1 Tax=Solanum tuberosum TaxID=4113 RepID=A0ABQ7WDV9_SOLTU|nr:hypothetical protein KY289_005713 [Solanum tuberosum]KAH0778899.1 hypothetical protein KY290_005326 [Solanum tuberosum]
MGFEDVSSVASLDSPTSESMIIPNEPRSCGDNHIYEGLVDLKDFYRGVPLDDTDHEVEQDDAFNPILGGRSPTKHLRGGEHTKITDVKNNKSPWTHKAF